MLDSETRRRIDTARDILVGKVPDPKSQVEQITIALVYKFMDDMDKQSIEMGGKASFFKGKFAKYGWSNIFDPRLGGIEMLALYGEAITNMSQNENLPQLFRDIFKNAFLPYRDPETLKLFLKTINEFTYDHSEKLGDAFEYLLSVLGSQGDAGQFRTPRHIIDFMVQVIGPKKNETVLDPACGTAGFLISAYKYMVQSAKESGKPLNAQDKKRIYENFTGYDISPDMVRLSLVNLYLHGFVTPNIHEYDSLTSEERWNEYADVILANPPFMSPKGGIQPHKRFSVQSNRSEVLFVDYMAEHLTPNGRAAIIVPEGIIFQSAGAYKQLRKYLIEHNYLWAVVSLPAGAFNPYSGVKTSILLLDKALAKKTDQILFVKVEADGFDLGAQRRPIDRNDLPDALNTLHAWQKAVQDGKPASFSPTIDSALLVSTSRIAENGEYTLTGERYREVTRIGHQTYPMVALGEICNFINGRAFKPTDWEKESSGGLPIIRIQNLNNEDSEFNFYSKPVEERYYVKNGDLLFSWSGSRGTSFGAHIWNGETGILNQHIFRVEFSDKLLKEYLHIALNKAVEEVEQNLHGGVGLVHITKGNLEKIQIPLPPLEIQRQIVDEIAAHQRIIDGARQVVDGWKPDIEAELTESLTDGVKEWKIAKLSDVCEKVANTIDPQRLSGDVRYVGLENIESNSGLLVGEIDSRYEEIKSAKSKFIENDVLFGKLRPNLNKVYLADFSGICSTDIYVLRSKANILPAFLATYLRTDNFVAEVLKGLGGAQHPRVNFEYLANLEIPLPPLEAQREIVARIERERSIVEGNRELIRIYEEKVKKVIERVWES